MRHVTFIALAAAALVVAGAALLVVNNRDKAVVVQSNKAKLLPDLAMRLNDVALIEIATSTKGNYSLRREGDGWVMPEKGGYPVKADKVKKSLTGIADLTTTEPRTNNPELYGRIGVQDPGKPLEKEDGKGLPPEPVLVRLKDDKGAELAAVILGRVKSTELASRPAEINVRKAGDLQAWLAEARLEPSADPLDWIERALPKVKRDEVAEVLITQPDGSSTRLFRDKPEAEGFTIDRMPQGYTVNVPFEVNAAAQALEFASLQDVQRLDPAMFTDKNNMPVTTAYRMKNGLSLSIRTVNVGGKRWINVDLADGQGADEPAKSRAAELVAAYRGWAFEVNETIAKDLTRRTSDLIKKEEKADDKGEAKKAPKK